MTGKEEDLNPYLTPKARLCDEPQPRGSIGVGYFLILLLNAPGLFMSYAAFHAIGDAYGAMFAMVAGLPLVLGQALIGVAPARMYHNRYAGRIAPLPLYILFGASLVTTALLAIVMVLVLAMPTTRGGC